MIPIIFGYKSKPTVEAGFKHKCVCCGKQTIHGIVRVTKWFTLFFIPLIPFSDQLFVGCNACGMKHQLQGDEREKMEAIVSKHKQLSIS